MNCYVIPLNCVVCKDKTEHQTEGFMFANCLVCKWRRPICPDDIRKTLRCSKCGSDEIYLLPAEGEKPICRDCYTSKCNRCGEIARTEDVGMFDLRCRACGKIRRDGFEYLFR